MRKRGMNLAGGNVHGMRLLAGVHTPSNTRTATGMFSGCHALIDSGGRNAARADENPHDVVQQVGLVRHPHMPCVPQVVEKVPVHHVVVRMVMVHRTSMHAYGKTS